MKNRFRTVIGCGGTGSLILWLGCTTQSAQQAPQDSDAVPAAPIVASSPARAGEPATPTPTIERSVEPAAPPTDTKISPAASEIVKLAQAGVGEDVMLSYIDNATQAFRLTPDGIVYLNDLGVTSTVITRMIQRDTHLSPATITTPVPAPAQPAPVPPVVTQVQPLSNVPTVPARYPASQPLPVEVQPQPAPPIAVPSPAADTQVAYFYDSLAPYGSWMYVEGYGWCWRPTVAVTYAAWQPYCDSGRWYWSDSGWFWHSDYSWGWAPFHYGRWFRHGHAGWIWHPDTVWGASWVSWRYTDGYCGWAPLPPAAHFTVGVGFSFHGALVGAGFEFGLLDVHYAWVPSHRFCDYNPRRFCEPSARAHAIFGNSTVANHYAVYKTTIVNHGIGHDAIRQHVGNELRTVSIREQAAPHGGPVRAEHLQKEGAGLVVYRPQLAKTPPAIPAAVTHAPRLDSPRPATPTASLSHNSSPASSVTSGPGKPMPERRITPSTSAATVEDHHSEPDKPTPATGNLKPALQNHPTPPLANRPVTSAAVPPKGNASLSPTMPPLSSQPRVSNVPQTYTPTLATPNANRTVAPMQPNPRTELSTPKPSTPAPNFSRSETDLRPPSVFHQEPTFPSRSAPTPSYSTPSAAPTATPHSSPSSPTHSRGDKSDRSR